MKPATTAPPTTALVDGDLAEQAHPGRGVPRAY